MREIRSLNIIRGGIDTGRDEVLIDEDDILLQYENEWNNAWKDKSESNDILYRRDLKLWSSKQQLEVGEADICAYFMRRAEDRVIFKIAEQIIRAQVSKIVVLTQDPLSVTQQRLLTFPLHGTLEPNGQFIVPKTGPSSRDSIAIEHLAFEPQSQRYKFHQLVDELLDE